MMSNINADRFKSSLEILRFKYSLTGNLVSQFLLDMSNGQVTMAPGIQHLYYTFLRNKLGDYTKTGILQTEINRLLDNVLVELRRDFPYFTRQQRLIFSLSAAGVPDRLIAMMARVKSQKMVWVIKNQMTKIIMNSSAKRKGEYLLLLDCQQLSRTTSVGGIRS